MQQHSSMILFCDECGAANEPGTAFCVACQQSLAPVAAANSTQVAPVRIAPPPVREVVAGSAVTPAQKGLPLNLLPGTLLFGRYQYRQEIGRGGFSVVYLAEDLQQQRRPVAIKRIHLSTLTAREIIDATETCNREIKLLTELRSVSGVPRLYSSFTDPENWYLVMEYIPGQTLEEYMQQFPGGYMPERMVLELGVKLTELLNNLHSAQHQVIFRDVKPANVMITPDGKLYLIDFGIARFFTPGQRKDTTPLGTPGFAPPEQYGRAQTDPRADVYSLGVTLRTLVTGRDPLELTQGERSRNPRAFSSGLRKLLEAMTNPDALQRPSNMQNVRTRLSRLQNFVDKGAVARSLVVGAALGALASVFMFWVFNGNGGFFGILWPLFFLTNLFNRKKGSQAPRFLKQFVGIGFAFTLAIGFVLWIIIKAGS